MATLLMVPLVIGSWSFTAPNNCPVYMINKTGERVGYITYGPIGYWFLVVHSS